MHTMNSVDLSPPKDADVRGAASSSPQKSRASVLSRSELHSKIKTAFRDMKRAETDHDYESARAAFNDLSRAMADMGAQDVDAGAEGYVLK